MVSGFILAYIHIYLARLVIQQRYLYFQLSYSGMSLQLGPEVNYLVIEILNLHRGLEIVAGSEQ